MAFRVVRMASRRVAAVDHTGPCECLGGSVQDDFVRIETWARRKGLRTMEWMSLWHWEDEDRPDQWRSTQCIAIRGKPRGGAGIAVRAFPRGKFVQAPLNADGTLEEIHGVYDDLWQWARARGYAVTQPAIEIYRRNPYVDREASRHARLAYRVRART